MLKSSTIYILSTTLISVAGTPLPGLLPRTVFPGPVVNSDDPDMQNRSDHTSFTWVILTGILTVIALLALWRYWVIRRSEGKVTASSLFWTGRRGGSSGSTSATGTGMPSHLTVPQAAYLPRSGARRAAPVTAVDVDAGGRRLDSAQADQEKDELPAYEPRGTGGPPTYSAPERVNTLPPSPWIRAGGHHPLGMAAEAPSPQNVSR